MISAASFIRLTASGIFDRRDHAVKKKIIHVAAVWKKPQHFI
jgi:hypothetical protein